MSFLKIKDPKRRELIVKEFLETKKNIQQSQLHERAGEREFQRDLGKFFKPVTDVQKTTAEEIKEELQPLKEIAPAIATIPGPLALPGPTPDVDIMYLGPIATEYLKDFGSKSGTDKTFGLYTKKGNFYLGDKLITIVDDNIFVDGKEYEGTKGLWELITAKNPDEDKITSQDFKNYEDLLFETNAVFRNNDPSTGRPKASKGHKWKNIIKPMWYNIDLRKSGEGLSDPNLLLERLDLLIESKKAGNTGVQNEIVSICDNLKKQNILNSKEYKKLVTKCW